MFTGYKILLQYFSIATYLLHFSQSSILELLLSLHKMEFEIATK